MRRLDASTDGQALQSLRALNLGPMAVCELLAVNLGSWPLLVIQIR